MTVIEHWTLDMSDDERQIIVGVREGHGHEPLGAGMRSVEVVPADQLTGAVDRGRVDAALAMWDAFRRENNLDAAVGYEDVCETFELLRGKWTAPDPRPDDVRCTGCGDTRPGDVIDCPRCDVPRGHVHGGRGGRP